MSLGTFRENNPNYFKELHDTGQLSTYYIPFKISEIPSDMKIPLCLANASYVVVEADNQAHAITKAKRIIRVPHSIDVTKIVEY